MHKLDEYESVFRASSKARFVYQKILLNKALLITDVDREESERLLEKVQKFLRDTHKGDQVSWEILRRGDYQGMRNLLEKIEAVAPDLVITQRCLTEEEKNPPFSLGQYLDVLTQVTTLPILVLPDQESAHFESALERLGEIVVVTDHLTGDNRLINWGGRFVPREGKLILTHVEDEAIFDRYMSVIGKIPELATERARELILKQLLREPREFIEDVRRVYREQDVPIEVLAEIRHGHVTRDFEEILEAHEGDLLVLNTKDDEQMAMHGNAYAIAVEYRHVCLLLL
jgi:nucleotide-binding universal stress UspA family protein